MVNRQEAAALSAALAFLIQAKPQGAEPHIAALAAMLASHAAQAANIKGRTVGRPAAAIYSVALGDLWRVQVTGARAAYDLICKTLAENPSGGEPPKLASMQVNLSRKGAWWRLVETDAGQQALEVRRVPPEELA